MKIDNYEGEIVKILDFGENVKHFFIRLFKDCDFEPGQFISVEIPKGKEIVRRCYSICSWPKKEDKKVIELCIKKVENGIGTGYLFGLKEGAKIKFVGPLGKFVLMPNSKKKDIVFVSSGAGIAPFRCMTHNLLESGFKNNLFLLAGYRKEKQALYEEEFLELEKKYKNFVYWKVISQPELENYSGEKGHVQELIEKYISKFDGDFYLCGLSDMVEDVRHLLLKKGVKEEQIFYEKYDSSISLN